MFSTFKTCNTEEKKQKKQHLTGLKDDILICVGMSCVCLQGGYATYRYAQPAAATAAAYSDR